MSNCVSWVVSSGRALTCYLVCLTHFADGQAEVRKEVIVNVRSELFPPGSKTGFLSGSRRASYMPSL